MSKIAIVCLLAAFVVIVSAGPQAGKYTIKYDNVDLDQILKNQRLLENYYNCLMDKGKCTPDGQELKRNLPDALNTRCSKCSEKQKEGTQRVVEYLIKNKPDWWKNLENKYDPSGNYRKNYSSELAQRGIKV
uniref:Chemosensory protein n=1 Tax=Agrilus zanthoxylumi TaxID=2696312 RepID=A0A6G6CCY5_9COLE|nr:chemosensory protein [Agrilus zanthoxylumi]QTJ02339.1 chemosensory protein [Agrilus zanthoxylumi]